jgi:hypothetical protein
MQQQDSEERYLMLKVLRILGAAIGLASGLAAGAPTDATDPPGEASAQQADAGLELDPTRVCKVLQNEGLQVRGVYTRQGSGGYQCASHRKALNAGGGKSHEIRFLASGAADKVQQLGLELSVYSKQDMQRAHRLLVEYADLLTRRALDMPLPAEVSAAIMGAVTGQWSLSKRSFRLRRASLPNWGHELRLTIR